MVTPRTARRSTRARLLAALASTIAATGLAVAIPGTAHAASSCWSGPTVTDYRGRTYATSTCPTWTGAYVLSNPWQEGEGALRVGYLYAGNNWMACQYRGSDNPPYGGYSNHYWLYTQADVAYGSTQGWGWLPATAVSVGGDEEAIPGVPFCAEFDG
ncbi:MAG: hypothetical protein JXA67_08250 [Micromonosporaceae bacterium]|nr:hypothetical protein [Micromonosporaceae bacterium]